MSESTVTMRNSRRFTGDHKDFELLGNELDRWADAAAVCTFWWRDDDLVQHSANLARLQNLADRNGIEVLVSVIPDAADSSLGRDTSGMKNLVFCQHGFRHVSHEPDPGSKSEFGPGRAPTDSHLDLSRGYEVCRAIFGGRFFPVLVPPWNAITADLIRDLPGLGYSGLSLHGLAPPTAGGDFRIVNTHVDVVDWQKSAGPGLMSAPEIDKALASILKQRRMAPPGAPERGNPTGLLTHHRVFSEGDWEVLKKLLELLREHPCVQWLSPREIFIAHAAAGESSETHSGHVTNPAAPTACNICGGTELGPGPNGRMAANGNPPHCNACGALERQRVIRAVFQALPGDFLRWRRALQFSRDPGLDPGWFRSHEVSIYGGANSLDIRAIDRKSGSYDFVSLNHVLEFIREDRQGFQELVRLLSTRGILQICFSAPLSREQCLDFTDPHGPFQAWHLYGRDITRHFRCAGLGLHTLAVIGSDPCTGVTEVVHLFLRDGAEAANVRAWLAARRIPIAADPES